MLLLLMFTLRSEPGDYWNCFPRENKFNLPLCASVFHFLVRAKKMLSAALFVRDTHTKIVCMILFISAMHCNPDKIIPADIKH
ncbi:hypothetical protein FKM82_006204 [Ascaphus truei]